MKLFKDIREKFNQKVPSGKKLVDMEVFLDGKDIDKALKILTTELKKAKLTFNKKMKNLKRNQDGIDVMINAIDEGERWRLIVLPTGKGSWKEVDFTSAFMAIQKLPSAQFKSMYAEGVKEESEDEQHKLVKGIEVILKTNSGKLKMKFNVDVSGYVHYSRPPQKSALIYDPKKFGWKKPIKNNRDLLNFTKVLLKKVPNLMKDNVNEATGREITVDWDFGDPTDYYADWQDQGVYLDDWDERKMTIDISGTDKDLLKWLIDDYGMDKREAQNVIRKGKRIKI